MNKNLWLVLGLICSGLINWSVKDVAAATPTLAYGCRSETVACFQAPCPTRIICVDPAPVIDCGWCGASCVANSAGKVCPMMAPPSGQSCVSQNGICSVVLVDKSCSIDTDCATNEYCYQPPMPPCPTGEMCKMMMPMRVCRPKTEVGIGQVCGGLRGTKCPTGLTCEYPKPVDGRIVVDQTGVCVAATTNKCGWCGLSCSLVQPNMACTKIAPPEGKICVEEANGCAIKVVPTVTGGQNCMPVPACVDGIAGPNGTITYCDLKPGVIYCPRLTPTGLVPTVSVKLAGDANLDGRVDLADFGIWKKDYLQFANTEPEGNMAGDFDGNGKTDLADFSIWKNSYLGMRGLTGTQPPPGCKWVDIQCIQAPCPRQLVCPIPIGN